MIVYISVFYLRNMAGWDQMWSSLTWVCVLCINIHELDNKLSIQNLINIIENNLRRDRSSMSIKESWLINLACTLTTEETYSLVWELLSHITIYHPVDLQQALLILNSLLDSDRMSIFTQ